MEFMSVMNHTKDSYLERCDFVSWGLVVRVDGLQQGRPLLTISRKDHREDLPGSGSLRIPVFCPEHLELIRERLRIMLDAIARDWRVGTKPSPGESACGRNP